ncbi:hypothetical protein C8R45DRAFT_940537 [Mycena sanguinolenta]|nr:hypothetical protein C8R45DRAFT_940537 [Mycena sanguinolenta]
MAWSVSRSGERVKMMAMWNRIHSGEPMEKADERRVTKKDGARMRRGRLLPRGKGQKETRPAKPAAVNSAKYSAYGCIDTSQAAGCDRAAFKEIWIGIFLLRYLCWIDSDSFFGLQLQEVLNQVVRLVTCENFVGRPTLDYLGLPPIFRGLPQYTSVYHMSLPLSTSWVYLGFSGYTDLGFTYNFNFHVIVLRKHGNQGMLDRKILANVPTTHPPPK